MAKVSVRIDIAVGHTDGQAVEYATGDLREELRCLAVDSVEVPKSGQTPPNAKVGADLAVLGALLLTAPDSALLSGVVEIIKSWVGRSSGRTARLEIDGDVLDVQGLSDSEQKLLIEQWIDRHDVSDN